MDCVRGSNHCGCVLSRRAIAIRTMGRMDQRAGWSVADCLSLGHGLLRDNSRALEPRRSRRADRPLVGLGARGNGGKRIRVAVFAIGDRHL